MDDRAELSNTKKLNYLRQAITDPSLQLLLNAPLESADTYVEIIKELKERFQKTREIHRTITKTLTSLPCPKHTRSDLRLLHDVVKTSIYNLKSTKQYDIESFLSSIIYSVLPGKLQILWDQATKKDKGVPSITQLLLFIKDHAETLSSAASTPSTDKNSDTQPKKPYVKKEQQPTSKHNVHVVTPTPNSYQRDCLLCAPEKHPLYVCPQWATYSMVQRIAHISSNSLCSNCLAGGHTTSTWRPHHIHLQVCLPVQGMWPEAPYFNPPPGIYSHTSEPFFHHQSSGARRPDDHCTTVDHWTRRTTDGGQSSS